MADSSGKRELQSAIEAIQGGEFEKAEKILLEITAREPKDFNSNHMLGVVFTELNKFEQAEKFFKTSLSINPKNPSLYKNYGFFLTKAKQFDGAIEQFNIALRLSPNFALAYSDRGNALEKLHKLDEAIADYNCAIALAPEIFGFYHNRGGALLRKQQYLEALADFERAIKLNPNFADAHCGYGNVLVILNRYEEALAAYEKALAIKPDSAGAWLGRGNVFLNLKRYDDAFAAYNKAVLIEPDLAEAHHARANILHVLTRNEEALNSLNTAIELDPIDPRVHLSRGLVLLTLGKYADAWEEYEWRRKLAVPIGNRNITQPSLVDLEGIGGATVFLYGEQGWGDHIHFCRYVKLVSDKGAKVVLESPKPLFQLFKTLHGVSHLIEADQPIPPFDYHCPLMSLPGVFQTTLDNVPNKVPYLFAEPDKVQAWAAKLGAKSNLRIGLAWAGGFLPNQPETRSIKERRNIPLAKFAPLKNVDAAFYSLQKGEQAGSELKELLSNGWNGPDIIDWTGEIHDFSDTAALIQNLDLVISVDTSTAHLAGAMAKPVWLLNRFDIEWRWLPNSPWYPTVRLFRQQAPGDWVGVIDRLIPELENLVRAHYANACITLQALATGVTGIEITAAGSALVSRARTAKSGRH